MAPIGQSSSDTKRSSLSAANDISKSEYQKLQQQRSASTTSSSSTSISKTAPVYQQSATTTTTTTTTTINNSNININSSSISNNNSNINNSSNNSNNNNNNNNNINNININNSSKKYVECPLCVALVKESSTPSLAGCRHRVCLECMQRYITTEINNSRLNITCPVCSEPIHPNTIKDILQNEKYYLKYEKFMLRRVLAAEPDARWCPAPDCGFVVLANGCASCPRLVCGRDGCNTSFCYHCKQEWHPNQTCSAASIQRNKRIANIYTISDFIDISSAAAAAAAAAAADQQNHQAGASSSSNRKSSKSSSQQTPQIKAEDIKECPVCNSRIVKMNDGSCNHMTCSICETEFCWLCMKEITDLHYFSPSGCTFWGRKPWSRKKKLLWRLGMLVGAPVCIILIAGIAVPAIVIGIPVWAARKLHTRLERNSFSRFKKNAIITGGVLLSFVVSPIISAAALAIGIPILLGYVYGVVPLSLCRSSGGCLSSAPSVENLQQEFQQAAAARSSSINIQSRDGISIDTAMSHRLGDPSIGETSLNMSNISLETNSIGHVTTVERADDRESNKALAGSIISNSNNVEGDGNSTRALAGSIISKESATSGGYTLIPAEVHNSSSVVFVSNHGSNSNHDEQPATSSMSPNLSSTSPSSTSKPTTTTITTTATTTTTTNHLPSSFKSEINVTRIRIGDSTASTSTSSPSPTTATKISSATSKSGTINS